MVMIYSNFIAKEPSPENLTDLRNNLSAKLDSECISLCSEIALKFHFDNELSVKGDFNLSHILDFRGSASKHAPINNEKTVDASESIFLDFPELSLYRKILSDVAPTVLKAFFHGLNADFGVSRHLIKTSDSKPSRDRWGVLSVNNFSDPKFWDPKTSTKVGLGAFPISIKGLPTQNVFNPPERPTVGKISALYKDQSLKVRWVASPLRSYQLMLKPMGDALFNLMRELPWDCTFDQQKGINKVQQWLREGRKCYSFDLKSSTDYLPLALQMMVFKQLSDDPVWKELCALFHWVATGNYRCKEAGGLLRWYRGQPMGLYPSFPGLALGHAAIAHYASRTGNGDFCILGDDIVIVGDSSAQLYRKVMETLGCQISEKKTFISNTTAEFAGKIIRSDAIYNCVKWKAFDDDNFLQKIIMLGGSFLKFLSPRQRKVFHTLKCLQPPYGLGTGVDLELSVMLTDAYIEYLSIKDPVTWDPRPLSGAYAQGFSNTSLFVKEVKKLLEFLDERVLGWMKKEDHLRQVRTPEVFSTYCRLNRITPRGLPCEQKVSVKQSNLTILQKAVRKFLDSGVVKSRSQLPFHRPVKFSWCSALQWVESRLEQFSATREVPSSTRYYV
jgi:hypothetical protein